MRLGHLGGIAQSDIATPPAPYLSGLVLRDAARLSQRYPLLRVMGVLGVSTWPIGCDTPFSELFPLGEHAKWRCYTPATGVSQRYWCDTTGTRQNGCDIALCDILSQRYCAIRGRGISHSRNPEKRVPGSKTPMSHLPTKGRFGSKIPIFLQGATRRMGIFDCDPGRHLQECSRARAGKCAPECFLSDFGHLAPSAPQSAF